MIALWLFLYLGSLVQMLTLYRLDLNKPATLFALLPFLVLPVMGWLLRQLPVLKSPAVLRGVGLLSFACAVAMARILHLGFWDTRHLGVGALCAGVGLGLLLVVRTASRGEAGFGLWLWMAAWLYAGAWHPVLPFLGAGLSALLYALGGLPQGDSTPAATKRLHPFWTLLLLGLVLPKPWFDFNLEPGWAPAMAAFAVAVGVAGLAPMRAALDRLPSAALLLLLAVAFVAYPSAWAPVWAAAVGLVFSALWRRLPRPLSLALITYGFLVGLLVSYALHSNLGVPMLRRFIWWGS